MPTLYLLIDFTHLSAWHYSSFITSNQILKAHQIELAPPFPGSLPKWSQYWYQGVNTPNSPEFSSMIAQVETGLESGHNIILPGSYFDFSIARQYLESIKQKFEKKADIQAIVFYENPAMMLDWWWRKVPSYLQSVVANRYVYNAARTSRMLDMIRNIAGQENTRFIFTEDKGISAPIVKKQLTKFFHTLKLEDTPLVSRLYADLSWTPSNNAKLLIESMEVGQNAWPAVNMDAAYAYMISWHNNKDWLPGVPWQLRERFLAMNGNAPEEIGAITGIDKSLLEAPESFRAPQEYPLKQDELDDFILNMPQDLGEPVFTRLKNDKFFLTGLQQQLLARAEESGRFSHLVVGEEQPVLTVLTLAYNHEKYIAECMDSVLAQQTDFKVRHIVLDNYSTDGTPEIIKKYANDYPSIQPVLLQGQEHRNHPVRELFNRARSEYVSICEGDDYFIHPQKLQKQIDYLRANDGCSVCFHPVHVRFEDKPEMNFVYPPENVLPRNKNLKLTIDSLFGGNIIQTNSVVYRWRFRNGLPDWFDVHLCPGDWYWHLLHAETGWIGFLPEVMSVYRRHAKALYSHAFIDTKAHRKSAGLSELRTFDVVNRHFKGKWNDRLNILASGVFADFLKIYNEEDDMTLLDEACRLYPDFARFFLKQVNVSDDKSKNVN